MCGVVGLLAKDPALEPGLGAMLVPMVAALADRGPDSAGIAIYSRPDGAARAEDAGAGDGGDGDGVAARVRISFGSDAGADWPEVGAGIEGEFPGAEVRTFPSGAVAMVAAAEADRLAGYVGGGWPGTRVIGTGAALTVIKDTGRPEDMCRRHGVQGWGGYLAVAHTRMATESAVTVLHSHPFVPSPDLCVVHNGSFSNYASVRRRLEATGTAFDTDNDSEVAARLLSVRLAGGDDLHGATRSVMEEMDGFFTMVITSATGMSVVRDPFACKPAVVAETAGYVAVASEYRALAELPGVADADVFEPNPEEVYTWTR